MKEDNNTVSPETIREIKLGLEKLGVKGNTAYENRGFVVDVYVDGDWFGKWDINKNLFVE